MVIEFSQRLSTRDLDGVVTNSVEPAKVREFASIIASESGWPNDWLNDGAKGFLVGPISPSLLFEAPGIRVSRPSYEQLLAIKLCA